MFRASVFSDIDCIAFLERLARISWYDHGSERVTFDIQKIVGVIASLDHHRERKAADRLVNHLLLSTEPGARWSGAQLLRLLSTMVANGPKVFYPTDALCEYFEHVDVNLPLRDYAQSYPVVTVCLPPEYAAARGLECRFIASMLDSNPSYLTVLTSNVFSHVRSYAFISSQSPSIEHSLSKTALHGGVAPDPRVDAALHIATRVAINCNLYLVDKGFRVRHLLDERTRRLREARARREGRLLLPPQELLLTQDVVLGPTQSEPASVRPVTAQHHKRTHYRRGHWRMQPHGPQRRERRRVFIAPMLINSRFAPAERGERAVIYRSQIERETDR